VESTSQDTNRSETVERLHDQLQASLQELVTSEDWQQALAVAARFHNYSFSNTQLIRAQALARGFTPGRVAGYRMWQQLGRQVRRGEHGLQILAPIIRKTAPDNGEQEERQVVGFRAVNVFDISQTDGEPLPEVTATLVDGDLPAHWDRVSELITTSGYDLQVANADRLGDANGITDWHHKDVVVRASLPGAQRFKTAVHELAHIRLHEPTTKDRPSCRGIVEVEAESVAYMVCAAIGIDSAGYSLPYVASWSGGDVSKVAATANRVIGCAREVITQLEHGRRIDQRTPRIESNPRPEAGIRAANESRPDLTPSGNPELEEALTTASSIYQRLLHDPVGKPALEYLHRRGITEQATSRWNLGYAPPSWDALGSLLHNEGYNDDILLKAGIVGRSRTGQIYDHMRGRLIFPIHDEHDTPRGFAGRLITGKGPKYLNTPETNLYQKRSLLYGIHHAQEPIRKADEAIVVEGYTDAIATHQAGITNTIATGGTALTTQHIETLAQITNNLTLAFDGDQAGLTATQRTAQLEQPGGLRMRVARLPEGRDPADLLTSPDAHLLQQGIRDAVPLAHHLITQTVQQHDLAEPEAMARAIRAADEIMSTISNADERTQAITHLANLVGRDEALIRAYLANHAPRTMRETRRRLHRSLS
jgi:DNA primase